MMDQTLGLYLHVPFCKHACPYCDFYKMELRDRPARTRLDYPEQLAAEHDLLLESYPELSNRMLESVYFGGGTPSVLSPGSVENLINNIREAYSQTDTRTEVTLEANPENLTKKRCEAWRAAGITRLSIGVQSFNARDLKRLERLHERGTIYNALENARLAGFDNISIDLMFGLPEQTMEEWQENLDCAVRLNPQHISFYGLTIHKDTPFHDYFRTKQLPLPGEEAEAEMYLRGSEFLRKEGFEHYEISNFAQPHYRSRHNQRYWGNRDVIGLGAGAHSSLGTKRWQNPDDLDAWRRDISKNKLARTPPEELSVKIAIEEEIFRRLRTNGGFSNSSHSPADQTFFRWLESSSGKEAERLGWVLRTEDGARLSVNGWLLSDSILAAVLWKETGI